MTNQRYIFALTMKKKKSELLFAKAKTYFPGGVNSPVRAFRSVGGNPLFIEKGKGAYLWDADGNKYIDFCCSWGPLILGPTHPKVMKVVPKAAFTTFGCACPKINGPHEQQ